MSASFTPIHRSSACFDVWLPHVTMLFVFYTASCICIHLHSLYVQRVRLTILKLTCRKKTKAKRRTSTHQRTDKPFLACIHVQPACTRVFSVFTCVLGSSLYVHLVYDCLKQPASVLNFCRTDVPVHDMKGAALVPATGHTDMLCVPCIVACSCNESFFHDQSVNLSLSCGWDSWPCGWGSLSCGWDSWPCGWGILFCSWDDWPCGWGYRLCSWSGRLGVCNHRSHARGLWESHFLHKVPMYIAAKQNHCFGHMAISVTAASGSCRSHYTMIIQCHEGKTMKNYEFMLTSIDFGMRTFIRQKQHWFRCTLRLMLRRRRYCKRNCSLARALSLLLLLGGDIESNPGPSKEWLKKQAKKQRYLLQREQVLKKRKLDYAENPEPK